MTSARFLLMISLFLTAPAAAADDLYRDLGERPGIAKIVDTAMERWLVNPQISYTFDNLNLQRFKARLTDQICELTGGPCRYTGRNMYLSHKGLHISAGEFNALVEDLQDAMEAERVPFFTQNRLLAILAPMQRDIVTR
jgi:hemoglobin